MSRLRRILLAVLLSVAGVQLLWAWPWSRDMVVQIVIHTQQQIFLPSPGSISTNWEAPLRRDQAARRLGNPIEAGSETLEQGKLLYDTYCYVCHGTRGRGDGPVAGGAMLPADLTSERVRTQSDGELYHTIRHGLGTMPAYYERLAPRERWLVVHYVRSLAEKEGP